MTKKEIQDAVIKVFENGFPVPFTIGTHYQIIAPGVLPVGWVYPGITAIDPSHPFIHVPGGYEEKPSSASFNLKLCDSMNAPEGRRFFHNKKIITAVHNKINNRTGVAYNSSSEKPDLFEVNGITHVPPYYFDSIVGSKKMVVAASQAGHNFICQTKHGIFNKMCEELWRLSESGIDKCFFIALYTHKQDLNDPDICLQSYKDVNKDADAHYQTELNIYRNDITQIDTDYIHLLFSGVRPNKRNTYFHVFIIEKPKDLIFQSDGSIVRPIGYKSSINF